MTKRRAWLVLVSGLVVGVACGGAKPSQTAASPSPSVAATTQIPSTALSPSAASPACTPRGKKLEISSSATAAVFLSPCLAAPAGEDFTITFHNQSGVQHNVSIATAGLIDVLFEGKVVTGPTAITYEVKPIPAGTYAFYCKIHPTTMNGTFLAA
jgi:plastocyanin